MVVRVETTLRLVNDSQLHSEGWWKWSVRVEGSPEDLEEIERVTYFLHPTFPNPVVKSTDASTNFELKSAGWGEFSIAAEVTMKDGRKVRLERWLELGGGAQRKGAPDVAPPKRRPSVFLTYSIADKEIVAALSETLEQEGIAVHTAEQCVDTSDEISPQLERHMQHTDAVVALFSDPPSRWVEQEAVTAYRKGAYVLPVVVGDARPSGKLSGLARFELADVKYIDGLAQQIAARIRDHAMPEKG